MLINSGARKKPVGIPSRPNRIADAVHAIAPTPNHEVTELANVPTNQ